MKISSGTKCIRPVEPFDTGNFYLLSQGSVSECGNLYDINSKKKLYTVDGHQRMEKTPQVTLCFDNLAFFATITFNLKH